MPKLLANRWFRWTLLAVALSGLGVGIYRFTPPEPRWSVDLGKNAPFVLAVDGTRVVALPKPRVRLFEGPLRAWDTRTGVEVELPLTREPGVYRHIMSRNGQFFAGEASKMVMLNGQETPKGESLVLIDLAARKRMETTLEDTSKETFLEFSPQGDVLVRGHLNDSDTVWVYDTTNGKLLHRRQSAGTACYLDFQDGVLIHYVATSTNALHLEIWNPRNGKSIAILQYVCRGATRTPDGRYFVVQRCTPDGNPAGKWVVWNTRTYQIEAEFATEDRSVRESQFISPDGKWLAAYCTAGKDQYVELRELPTGRRVGKTHDLLHWSDFSPDSRFLVMDDQSPSRIVLDLPSLRIRWARNDAYFNPAVEYSRDGKTMFAIRNSGVQAFDSSTGRIRTVVSPPGNGSARVTRNCRWMCIRQDEIGRNRMDWLERIPWLSKKLQFTYDCVLVVDTDDCREQLRIAGWAAYEAHLSEDGQTLVTMHAERGSHLIRCWDVNAWKPLHWALGVPAGLAAMIGLLAWWRGRRRKVTQEIPSPTVALL